MGFLVPAHANQLGPDTYEYNQTEVENFGRDADHPTKEKRGRKRFSWVSLSLFMGVFAAMLELVTLLLVEGLMVASSASLVTPVLWIAGAMAVIGVFAGIISLGEPRHRRNLVASVIGIVLSGLAFIPALMILL
ncbi:MAG: hypothetical protein AAF206_22265 [Bacteroidota bacterium]